MKSLIPLLIILIIIDQYTKKIVLDGFRFSSNFFDIILVYNEGSAFGFKLMSNEQYLIVNSFILILFSFIIFYLYNKAENRYKFLYLVSLVFVSAGGVGNLIDRLIHGKVVDFISILNFPVFNLADVFVSIGVTLLVACFIFDRK